MRWRTWIRLRTRRKWWFLGDAVCAVMRAVAGLWAAASAAATAGRMEGMSSGCRFWGWVAGGARL